VTIGSTAMRSPWDGDASALADAEIGNLPLGVEILCADA